MLTRIFRLYFPRVPAEIPIGCERAVAVRRLERSLLSWGDVLSGDHGLDGVRGTAQATRVVLHRVQSMGGGGRGLKGNAWKPWLFARFERSGGAVVLRGAFRVHPFTVAFSLLFLTVSLAAALCTSWILVLGPPAGIDEPMPVSIPAMAWIVFLGGSALVVGGWRWSEDDIGFLERFVRESTAEGSEHPPDAEQGRG